MKNILLIFFFMYSSTSFSKSWIEYQAELKKVLRQDPEKLYFPIMDNPGSVLKRLDNLSSSLEPAEEPLIYARILYFYTVINPRSLKISLTDLPAHLKVLANNKDWKFWGALKAVDILRRSDGSSKDTLKDLENILRELRQTGDEKAICLYLSSYALYLIDRQHMKKALKHINEALQIAEANKHWHIYFLNKARNALGNFFNYKVQIEKAVDIYQRQIKVMRKNRLRFAESEYLYNMATTYLRSNIHTKKVFQLLTRSLKLSEEINNFENIAASLYALSKLDIKMGLFKKAINRLERVLSFKDQLDNGIIPHLYKYLGIALIQEGRDQEAIKSIDKALALIRIESKMMRSDLFKLKAQAYYSLKEFEKAFKFIEDYAKIRDQIAKEEADRQYNRASAEIGLKIEEERNDLLVREKKLQVRQSEIDQEKIRLLKEKEKEGEQAKLVAAVIFVLLCLSLFFAYKVVVNMKKVKDLQNYIHKSVLSRFLPPVLVNEIMQGKSRLDLEPTYEKITVIFADIVGFTKMFNENQSNIATAVLNRFMKEVTEVVYQFNGTIDKFIGDAVMVLFGAPIPLPDIEQAERAIACAKALIRKVDELNLEFRKKFSIEIAIRVGINQGDAIVGVLGGEKRSDYTAVGHTVNVASRVEGLAKPQQIVFTKEIADLLDEEKDSLGQFSLKGVDEKVELFHLKNISSLKPIR